ncbi:MAG TPA: response regulator transcription factor [Saprospiraceae bacterium]|mgnify:FL=1|nr:response regulator transcription factor [Saprospiraceae bacterium]MCB9268173.1 response regulator transcription factor [Lewinellaceae bacterium]HPG09650.1 response regulator transcription factor [Saprospiraceae bacterium]HPR01253.1 response regulator transcription factor [Saprospiraceae bacterium]HQU54842.1 response regulator transcription factor [Saprospiraceae bacterium]
MNKAEILVIDDEPQIRKLLQISLESNDYRVVQAVNAREGLSFAALHPPDLILLDLGLPDKSGHDVLKEFREWYSRPIIILSVVDDEQDIVAALDHGASDYLTKPFRTGELLARIRSAIRRSINDNSETNIVCRAFEINLIARTVKMHGQFIKLTGTEYNLIALFARNEGKVLTHQYILREIWGIGYQTETQYLRVFVGQLRKKLEENPNNPQYIITESGVGYRFQ